MGTLHDRAVEDIKKRSKELTEREEVAWKQREKFVRRLGEVYDDLKELAALGLEGRTNGSPLAVNDKMPRDDAGVHLFVGVTVSVGTRFVELRPSKFNGQVQASGQLASRVTDAVADNSQFTPVDVDLLEEALLGWLADQDLVIADRAAHQEGGDANAEAGVSADPGHGQHNA